MIKHVRIMLYCKWYNGWVKLYSLENSSFYTVICNRLFDKQLSCNSYNFTFSENVIKISKPTAESLFKLIVNAILAATIKQNVKHRPKPVSMNIIIDKRE